MSFGWSAAIWTAIGVGTSAAIAADSADTQRKAAHKQEDALAASKAADIEQQAKSEADANAALVDSKRRRRAASGLLAGQDPASASTSVLGSGGASVMRPVTPHTTLGGA